MNYFLYIVSSNSVFDHIENITIKQGEWGTGKCSLSPGITDAPYGVMYIAPFSYIHEQAVLENKSPLVLSSDDIAKYVISFFITN